MRRIVLLVGVVLSIFRCVVGQDDGIEDTSSGLTLTGKVKRVEFYPHKTDGTAHAQLNFTLEASIRNDNTVPVLLLGKHPVCGGVGLAETLEDLVGFKGSFASYPYFFESTDGSQWRKIKNRLDRPRPPSKLVTILAPGAILHVEMEESLRIPIDKSVSFSNFPSAELAKVLKMKHLFVQLGPCRFDDHSIIGLGTKDGLLKELERRWSPYGKLALSDFSSEPIEVPRY